MVLVHHTPHTPLLTIFFSIGLDFWQHEKEIYLVFLEPIRFQSLNGHLTPVLVGSI